MDKIKLEITVLDAKFISKILGVTINFMKSLDVYPISVESMERLKEKIDEELLKQ